MRAGPTPGAFSHRPLHLNRQHRTMQPTNLPAESRTRPTESSRAGHRTAESRIEGGESNGQNRPHPGSAGFWTRRWRRCVCTSTPCLQPTAQRTRPTMFSSARYIPWSGSPVEALPPDRGAGDSADLARTDRGRAGSHSGHPVQPPVATPRLRTRSRTRPDVGPARHETPPLSRPRA
jgi:hypothetical protein